VKSPNPAPAAPGTDAAAPSTATAAPAPRRALTTPQGAAHSGAIGPPQPTPCAASASPPRGGADAHVPWAHLPNPPSHGGPSFFLEIFSGAAGLTAAALALGLPCLPPVDVTVSEYVTCPTDVLQPPVAACLRRWIAAGSTAWVHFGTPCTTYSRARRLDGGPPPLRTDACLNGLPGLSAHDRLKVATGTRLMHLTCDLIEALPPGRFFTLENPWHSMIWLEPRLGKLLKDAGAARVRVDMCACGMPHMKPTAVVGTLPGLHALARACPGVSATHTHVPLRGTCSGGADGGRFRTKAAQVYPPAFCHALAVIGSRVFAAAAPLGHFHPALEATFALRAKPPRKRALGLPVE